MDSIAVIVMRKEEDTTEVLLTTDSIFCVWNERVSNMVVVSINVGKEHRFRQ